MKELIIRDLLELLIPRMKEKDIQQAYICTKFTESGSSVTEGNYLDEFGNRHFGLLASSKKLLREYQNQVKDTPHRFNTVEFEVNRDGSYKANYYWDEGIIEEQKRRNAQNIAGWLAQRIPTMIAYQGYALYDQFYFQGDIINNEDDSNEYGKYPSWRNGIFTFDFRNNNLKIDIEVKKATGRVLIPLEYEDWFINDLLEHYEITNNGILSNEWKPWNVLEINLEKDVRHDGGQNIEPEIKYILI